MAKVDINLRPQSVIPALLKRTEENRAEGKRQDKLTRLIKLQTTIYDENTSIEDKRKAAAEAATLGMSVPSDLLKPKPEPIDLSKAFEYLKVPEELRDVYQAEADLGLSKPSDLLKSGAQMGEKAGRLDLDKIKELHGFGFFEDTFPGMTPEQIDARIGTIEAIEKRTGDLGIELQSKMLGVSRQADLTTEQKKTEFFRAQITNAQGQYLPLEDVLASPDKTSALISNGMMPQLFKFYGRAEPGSSGGVTPTAQFNNALRIYHDTVGILQRKAGTLEQSLDQIKSRESRGVKLDERGLEVKKKLETDLKDIRFQVETIRFNMTDTLQSYIDKFGQLQIGGANPADFAPAGGAADRTAQAIELLKADIENGAYTIDDLKEEDFKFWEENGYDVAKIKSELGIE